MSFVFFHHQQCLQCPKFMLNPPNIFNAQVLRLLCLQGACCSHDRQPHSLQPSFLQLAGIARQKKSTVATNTNVFLHL